MDYQRRIRGLQRMMKQQNIDLVMYGSCPNHQYLTGIVTDWRGAPDLQPEGDVILVPREGEPVLIVSGSYLSEDCPVAQAHAYDRAIGYRGMLEAIVNGFSLNVRRLALGSYLPIPAATAIIAATGHPETCDGSHLMDALRTIKEPEEIDALRKVAQLTDEVMKTVIGDIQDGTSQMDLMLAMRAQALRMGATDMSFGPWACFVKSGSSTPFLAANPNQVTDYPVDKGIVANTAITFDVGFVLDGYCSDWGRSVYWGTPPADVKNAYAALRHSVVDTVAEIRPGMTKACDIYPAIEKKLDASRFGDQMRARLGSSAMIGHQIGTEVHENPWLRPDSADLLRPGMVMCIEPKLWVPGEYYLRLEEMVHVTDTGAEFLTSFDRELFEL